MPWLGHVRYAPLNGHATPRGRRQLSAKSGHLCVVKRLILLQRTMSERAIGMRRSISFLELGRSERRSIAEVEETEATNKAGHQRPAKFPKLEQRPVLPGAASFQRSSALGH
jgi:hypothetical protein